MNTYIRTLYSPERASVTFSFYKTNLALNFSPWIGPSRMKLTEYNKASSLSTTISDDSAAALYYLAKNIVDGKIKDPIRYEIPCNRDAMIIFEFDPGQAYLAIEKNGARIIFEFTIQRYLEKKDGDITPQIIQSGLIVFLEVLKTYLLATSADRQAGNIPEENYNDSYPASGW